MQIEKCELVSVYNYKLTGNDVLFRVEIYKYSNIFKAIVYLMSSYTTLSIFPMIKKEFCKKTKISVFVNNLEFYGNITLEGNTKEEVISACEKRLEYVCGLDTESYLIDFPVIYSDGQEVKVGDDILHLDMRGVVVASFDAHEGSEGFDVDAWDLKHGVLIKFDTGGLFHLNHLKDDTITLIKRANTKN